MTASGGGGNAGSREQQRADGCAWAWPRGSEGVAGDAGAAETSGNNDEQRWEHEKHAAAQQKQAASHARTHKSSSSHSWRPSVRAASTAIDRGKEREDPVEKLTVEP